KGYKEERSKKLLRSYDARKSVAYKGFILGPTKVEDALEVDACLALLQFDNEYGQDVSIERLGIYAFASGSRTSNMTLRDPRRSVTTTFVASKEKPFVAHIYARDKTLKFFCDDSGIKIYHVKEKTRDEKQSFTTKNKSIDILKRRLASGEITIEEYERLRRIILEDENFSPSWI
ncbi:MAG TPA: SHOCT domain-containing protein, partial [Nitrososphaeraceae archaeon]|nr:SHOCT domain-containing protein [Nitrososphaeraceae archaeon]